MRCMRPRCHAALSGIIRAAVWRHEKKGQGRNSTVKIERGEMRRLFCLLCSFHFALCFAAVQFGGEEMVLLVLPGVISMGACTRGCVCFFCVCVCVKRGGGGCCVLSALPGLRRIRAYRHSPPLHALHYVAIHNNKKASKQQRENVYIHTHTHITHPHTNTQTKTQNNKPKEAKVPLPFFCRRIGKGTPSATEERGTYRRRHRGRGGEKGGRRITMNTSHPEEERTRRRRGWRLGVRHA